MAIRIISLLLSIVILAQCSEPNPPVWPNTVKIFEAGDSSGQQIIDEIFKLNGGHEPAGNGEFSEHRFALLFKPGQHDLVVNVGYYTHVMGLGSSPYDTKIKQVTVENGGYDYHMGALINFWRIAENFYVQPKENWNGVDNTMLWSVSQASPLRRVVIDGNLQLYQYTGGDSPGYASGGFMSDCLVTGSISSGTQQQFFVRNTHMESWIGRSWNYVFVGSNGAPTEYECWDGRGTVNIPQTPQIAEKPFIVFQDEKYFLAVPRLKTNTQGPSDYTDLNLIDFSQVFVATEKDSAALINSKLNQGLHVVFTPGNYHLSESIQVTKPNTILLGLGLATLIPEGGHSVIVVHDVEGVRVGSLLLEAGETSSEAVMKWGVGKFDGNPYNPGLLQDLFVRVGGPYDPNQREVRSERQVLINSGNVILDDIWLWRADHHVAGSTMYSQNPNQVGIEVNGDNVVAYGLAVEHTLEDLVRWNGNNGKVFFYQSELPYDVTQENFGDRQFVSYRVGDNVSHHEAYGIGSYTFFRDNDVKVQNAIKTPNVPGIKFINSMTVYLSGNGQLSHIINDQGSSVQGPSFMTRSYCQYQGGQQEKFLN